MMDTTIYLAALSARHHPQAPQSLLVSVSWFATMLVVAATGVAALTALTYHFA